MQISLIINNDIKLKNFILLFDSQKKVINLDAFYKEVKETEVSYIFKFNY